MAKMKRTSETLPKNLPQVDETWRLAVREVTLKIKGEEAARMPSHALIIADEEASEIYSMEAFEGFPNAEVTRQVLMDCMRKPPEYAPQKPRRPREVIFEDSKLFHALKPDLHDMGVIASLGPASEAMDDIIDDLAETLDALQDEPPGLLSVEGTTPRMIADLFDAAAAFYRAAPWKNLENHQTMAAHLEPGAQDVFVQVLGNGEMEFGLVIYYAWDEVLSAFRHSNDPLEHVPPGGWHSVTYGSEDEMPTQDVVDTRKYGWKIASRRAYPLPMIFMKDGFVRPPRQELIAFEALLRAVPLFAKEHLRGDGQGDYTPAQAEVSVKTHDGPVMVHFKYPGGVLPLEIFFPEDMQEDGEEEWEEEWEEEDLLDEDETGLKISDALRRAQALAEEAQEEDDPKERVKLARQAIKISPECAEAYNILGDEANTAEKAQQWYQRGVEAGRRLLGTKFITEHEGALWSFRWGRPYLRAMQGLADALVYMGDHEAALAYYQELLNLDMEDEEGNRHPALRLLLSAGMNEEAADLLEEYEEDISCDWLYGRALVAFRLEGDARDARSARGDAIRYNPHVPGYLSGETAFPPAMPEDESAREPSEAITYAFLNYQNWWQTPGAIPWLKKGARLAK